jgi:hypothetical protein
MTAPKTYIVTVTRDPETRRVLQRWEDPEEPGVLHCDHGPAVVERDEVTDTIRYEAWYSRGKLHRDNSSPEEIWRSAGSILQVARQHGKRRVRYPRSRGGQLLNAPII